MFLGDFQLGNLGRQFALLWVVDVRQASVQDPRRYLSRFEPLFSLIGVKFAE